MTDGKKSAASQRVEHRGWWHWQASDGRQQLQTRSPVMQGRASSGSPVATTFLLCCVCIPLPPGRPQLRVQGACDLLHWPYLSSAIIAPHTCVHSSRGVASMCFHTHSHLLGDHFILAQVCQRRCRHADDVHTRGMQHHNFVSVTESGYVCVKIFSKTSA